MQKTRKFPEFYMKKITEGTDLMDENTLVVFDTNYLASVIESPIEDAKKYIKAIEKVKDHMFIPYYVALEFHLLKSRIRRERDRLVKGYYEKINQVATECSNLLNTPELIDSNKKNEFDTEKKKILDIFIKSYTELLNKHLKIESSIDTIQQNLLRNIENNIGDEMTQERIQEVDKDGLERYSLNIPPGFSDKDKTEVYQYNGKRYQTKYGDLYIWNEIIDYLKESKKYNRLVFVTDDGQSKSKTDIYYKYKGEIIGPDIHLINEVRLKANSEFFVLKNNRFVELALSLNESEKDKLDNVYRIKINTDMNRDQLNEFIKVNEEITKSGEFAFSDDGFLLRKNQSIGGNVYHFNNRINAIMNVFYEKYSFDFLLSKYLEGDNQIETLVREFLIEYLLEIQNNAEKKFILSNVHSLMNSILQIVINRLHI